MALSNALAGGGGLIAGLLIGAVLGITLERADGPPGTTPPDPSTTSTATATAATTTTTTTTPTPPASSTPDAGTPEIPPPTPPVSGAHAGDPDGPDAPAPHDPAHGLRIVQGIVVAEDAAPVPFAWVTGELDYRPAVEVQAGQDGKFLIAMPGTLPITLRARARYRSDTRGPEANATPDKFATLVLQVRDGGTLQGTVINDGGRALAGVGVTVEWKEPDDSEGLPELNPDGVPLVWTWHTTTDQAGAFRVAGCRPWTGGGHFLISAKHPSHHDAQTVIEVPDPYRLPEPFDASITMQESSVATARLLNADGTPVKHGVIMIIVRDGNRVIEWTRADVRDGKFDVRTAMTGTLVFVPIRDRLAGTPLVVKPPDDGSPVPEVVVTWKDALPLCTGQLLPPPGVSLFEATFHLTITSSGMSAGGPDIPVTYDEATGKFSLPRQFYGVEGDAAYAVLTVTLPGCKPKQMDFNLYDDETADLGELEIEQE